MTTPLSHIAPSSLDFSEISLILDSIAEAAILVDSKSQRIVAANGKFAEIAYYTRDELAQLLLEDVLIFDGKFDDLLTMRNFGNSGPVARLTTRNHDFSWVKIGSVPIARQWKLVTLMPCQNEQLLQISPDQFQNTLQAILAILERHGQVSLYNLGQLLEIGNNFLKADAIAIYISNQQKPSVRKAAAYGQAIVFPDEIFASELPQFSEPTFWQRGQRTLVSLLHQSAHKARFSYLATSPIQIGKGLTGILVVSGYTKLSDGADSYLQTLIQILGRLLSNLVADGILINNLRKINQHAEDEVRAANTVNNAIGEGLIIVNRSMKITTFNRAAEIILGYAHKEVVHFAINDVLIGTDRLIPAIEAALEGKSTPSLGDIQLHRRDGSLFPAKIHVHPIDQNANNQAALIVLQDRSEHEQFRIRSQQLEQRALLGEVTSVFAHEVRNPINNISTGLQLMADDFPRDDPNQDLIARLQQDCNRLADLMKSVLAFSRSGSYQLRPLDLHRVIERLIRLWAPRMDRLNVQREFIKDGGNFMVMGDLRALEQVFTNIISNAIEAMRASGGNLGIKIIASHPKYVQVAISDTGPGISEENISKIFDPFFTTKKDGTGLGLAITQQIMTAHKGSIKVTSVPGGTVFHLQLPKLENSTEIIS